MGPLAALIRARIQADGPISLDDYIETVLFHPDHGYYRCRQPFGVAGDFVTAPEISPLFADAIGRWVTAVWRQMGEPQPVWLVELGPGRGTLITGVLQEVAATTPDCLAALRLCLIEASPRLAGQQAEALKQMAPELPAVWLRHLRELPPGPILLIANEFFDALPIRQYVRAADGWRERRIGLDAAGSALVFVAGPALQQPPALSPALAHAPAGTLIEVCPQAEEIARIIAARIASSGGAALILDFGFARSIPGDSFQALREHRYADPLADPGSADLAHHVDFAALAQAAQVAGVRAHGPIAQGLWLGRMGVVERAEALAAEAPESARGIGGAVRRLIHPGQMGVLFKVLAFTATNRPEPPGFARGSP